ncbi:MULTISPECIES: hypothetical protein [unclassified Paenibacillus]|uniref:hypothetical protein n=1 Tax=unclassified Paenibacillus TaxID=185978 RepID=UPI0024076EEF|nr:MULTISPECIES: hypothetical protein [unclassified Paenibacillus]MDF9842181.1 hypothetical protein [Paenibacillus sp. PastF-2]MDF9848566.1 hypothetical protein [Paenibacillus sp. PastM-2]MDF9855135.1 hypothetical protein [Paenibacillus sp. PastF-1]MDH6480404.1 hypothetical protein [Paenibacillus sp. PastH-2]MDH6507834.1 hypothetical protein [Paenibacillus sp. PastM-3]
MYRVGIIGPAGSVERIAKLAETFAQEIEFISFIYAEPRETGQAYMSLIPDGWLPPQTS